MRHINKKIILGVLLITLLVAPIVALIAGCTSGPAISKDQAIAILVSEIIEPAAEYKWISAFMLSEPLQEGDVVTSEIGQTYPIDASTWFVFVDDEPMAAFVHDCRYVFINGETGSYDVVNETWLPEINNLSMWDTQSLGRGHIIELYSVLDSVIPIAGSPSQAPTGDYGDAPDGQDAYWGIPGAYPTLFSTTSSQFSRPGGHTLNIGEETLGLNVSSEVDANNPADPDGVPNLVDADSDERIFVIVEGTQAKLAFTVTVAPNAPDVTRYANALIDFDQNGSWSVGTYGTEWVLVNLTVDVHPGSSETVITPWFSWGNEAVLPSPVWMRLLLAREEVDETSFANVGGWDGSGQFEYGEVEDYFVFLTDAPLLPEYHRWPPAPGQPPRGDVEAELLLLDAAKLPCPGPATGPCGYNITYYSIIINGGDNAKNITNRCFPMRNSASRMANLTSAQNYTSIANLGPGSNNLSDISKAFDRLAGNVTCGDHVLIYICGHGGRCQEQDRVTGRITYFPCIGLYNTSGNITHILEATDPLGKDDKIDNTLADFLKKIPPCRNQDCNTAGKCCNVTVIIDACHAGYFNVTGVTGQGRTVIGSATNEYARWYCKTGYIYTQGFDKGSRNPASDTNGDGCVSPMEAHVTAVDAVNDYNKKYWKKGGANQTPWSEGDWCGCLCPASPGIDVEKWIWDELYGTWVDEIEVLPGALVAFVLEIESDGTSRDIVDLEIIDFLPYCLEFGYEFTPILYYNDMAYYSPPDYILQVEGGVELYWDLAEIGPLAPGESIAIEYYAYAEYPGENISILYGTAHCAVDPSKVVFDEDSATVWVQEDLLGGYLEVTNVESFWSDPYTCESFFDVYFEVQDLTGGTYPITYVGLYINGLLYDSWETNDMVVEGYVPDIPADCGETIDVDLAATNLEIDYLPEDFEGIIVGNVSTTWRETVTTPSPPQPVAEDVLEVGWDATCECFFTVYDSEYECDGCTVTIDFRAEDISGLGGYPVTNVVLKLDGAVAYDSGSISTGYFQHTHLYEEAWCGDTIEIEVIATNSIGQVIAYGSLTCPWQPS